MAGYDGYTMSNNARSAYSNGEKPFSKWTKAAILEAASDLADAGEIPAEVLPEMKKETKDSLLSLLKKSSWHHTSAKYNRTNFYQLSDELIVSSYGYKQVMYCSTPDGEKAGDWTERNESGFGFKHFTAADGTVYDRDAVTFIRFGFVKK